MGFGLFPIHEMENHKDMFETTNQITIIFPLWLVYTLCQHVPVRVASVSPWKSCRTLSEASCCVSILLVEGSPERCGAPGREM